MSQSQLKVFCDGEEIDPVSFYKRMTLSRVNSSLVKTHETLSQLIILPREIIHLIFSYNDNGKTHKAILETCKEAYETHKHLIHKYRDVFYTLLKKYPHKSWNMTYLSSNPRVTLNCIRSLCHLHWDYKKILLNNPNVTLDFALEYEEYCDREVWNHLSKNPNIATIKNFHSVGKFLYSGFSSNPNITFKFITDTRKRKKYVLFDMYEISKNPGITLKDIEDNPTFRWDWYGVSLNPNLTQDFVEKNVERLCWKNISCNKSIATPEYILKTLNQLPWDRSSIQHIIDQNITTQHIMDAENTTLSKEGYIWLSYKKNSVTREFFETYQDKTFRWDEVLGNCKEPLKVLKFVPKRIKENKTLMEFILRNISRNSNITIEDIEQNSDFAWDWKFISLNTFGAESDL